MLNRIPNRMLTRIPNRMADTEEEGSMGLRRNWIIWVGDNGMGLQAYDDEPSSALKEVVSRSGYPRRWEAVRANRKMAQWMLMALTREDA